MEPRTLSLTSLKPTEKPKSADTSQRHVARFQKAPEVVCGVLGSARQDGGWEVGPFKGGANRTVKMYDKIPSFPSPSHLTRLLSFRMDDAIHSAARLG